MLRLRKTQQHCEVSAFCRPICVSLHIKVLRKPWMEFFTLAPPLLKARMSITAMK
jgi:hypothetical protein